ncbi:MAG: efflux RND transporter periplasmic adaptor subunit [Acidobacteriota bacterium]|nr:efflux RND transporter periplasmic adaptor subunit [Acidobacteriota bacterium]MDQ7087462.1 efflux RND transporter periplasmic adaptor subunit [Acidobacteriota bacterium]
MPLVKVLTTGPVRGWRGVWMSLLAFAFFLPLPACQGKASGENGPQGKTSAQAESKRRAGGGRRGMGGGRPGRGPAGRKRQAARVPVILAPAGRDTMEAFLEASSTLEAEESVEVVSQATGVVVEVLAEEGDRVQAGQELARLAYEELELAEQKARTQLERLRADYARSEQLARQDLVSEEDFTRLGFDLKQAEIDWRQKALELERTRIVSPITGTITERMIRVGQLKRQNDPVYRLVDLASIVAPVFVPEKYLDQLRVGQRALLSAPALPGTRITGRVLRIAPVVDSQSGTVRVTVDPGTSARLRPGMFANVRLVLDRHEDVVVIPKKAIVYEDEQPGIFVVEAGKARRRAIEIGYQDELRAEVVSGLEAGELVVLVGQSALKDGSEVVAEDEQGRPIPFPAGDADPEATRAEEGAAP